VHAPKANVSAPQERRYTGAGRLPGISHAEAAQRLGVSVPTVKRWRREQRPGGSESLSAAG
jgi:transposase